ncbi:unnamed protein product [Alopecurus aequalis]
MGASVHSAATRPFNPSGLLLRPVTPLLLPLCPVADELLPDSLLRQQLESRAAATPLRGRRSLGGVGSGLEGGTALFNMAKFTTADIRDTMEKKTNIRNMSVIGHFRHGKSTIVDSLVAAAGIDIQGVSGDVHMTDTREDEAERGISIKATGISLLYDLNNESLEAYKGDRDGNNYLINLIDSPGHVDFSSEVTASLRITDGALLVIDCIEGVCVQTETVLCQALGERVRPVLCLNKMDKLFAGLQVESNKDEQLGDVRLYPHNGSIVFSSGLHGWAFTLTDIAKTYAPKIRMDESKCIEKLWGDHFYNKITKKWTTENTDPRNCVRGFVYLCYDPIKKIIGACMSDDKATLWQLCGELGLRMCNAEKELSGLALVKCVLKAWLLASTALLEMTIFHLPCPSEAQKYRVDKLYEGSLDDSYAQAIRSCDPEGPLMLYVSKMIPSAEVGRFFAFGRVFSGRIATGMNIRIMGPSYVPGTRNDMYVATVQGTSIWMGRSQDNVHDIPCGSTVCMSGLDQYITKSATLTNEGEVAACPIRAMKFSVSPVLYVTIECNTLADVDKLNEGLKRLAKSDPIVLCSPVKSRSCTVAGTGELHLETCLKDLQGVFMDGAVINISRPTVSLAETIIGESGTVDAKSPNGHNSMTIVARPLDKRLVQAIEDGLLGPRTDRMRRSEILAQAGWDEGLADKILCFGPGNFGPNMIVDMLKGGSNLNLVKKALVECFQAASKEGALAQEIMRGICFEIHKVVLHDNPIYRNEKNQLVKMFERAFHDSQLKAKPRLLEPVFEVEIQAPGSELHTIYGLLSQNSSNVLDKFERQGTQLLNLRSYLHGCYLVGFAEAFRAATSGRVTPQCVLSYWDTMASDPLKASSLSGEMVLDIRKKKKMKELSAALKALKL